MIEFKNETLDNGLTILAECNRDALSAAIGFFVKTGARDEEDNVAGVSHFLEHMLFKGTPTRSADDVNREFDELGAYYNAFTSEENTVFYAAVLPEYFDQTVALLADIMRPSLREDDFEMEKQVILEEIFMYEDQPPFGADEKARAEFWAGHPLARSVLGTTDTIRDLSAEQMRDYFRRRYTPGNVILAATGAVDFDELTHLAATFCGNWEPLGRGASGRETYGAHGAFAAVQGDRHPSVLASDGGRALCGRQRPLRGKAAEHHFGRRCRKPLVFRVYRDRPRRPRRNEPLRIRRGGDVYHDHELLAGDCRR